LCYQTPVNTTLNAVVVKGAFKMLERLNIKREKIADIQDVIYEGDVNKDGVLDFEEWRTKMKKYVHVMIYMLYLHIIALISNRLYTH